jgi:osmotically inducible protein OsmC
MIIRKADAYWEGNLAKGRGKMNGQSGKFSVEFTTGTRFGEDPGSNPDELLGAAYAGCFSMALANMLDGAGFKPKRIDTSAKVFMDKETDGYRIQKIELTTKGEVAGIDAESFDKYAQKTKDTCPISKAITGVDKKVISQLIK